MWTVIKAWPAALLAAVLLGGTYGAGYVRAKHTCTAETTQIIRRNVWLPSRHTARSWLQRRLKSNIGMTYRNDKAKSWPRHRPNWRNPATPYRSKPVQQWIKTAAALTVSALTACTSTNAPSDTPIKTVEAAVLPPVSSGLLVKYERPERPTGGSPEQLLNHVIRYGEYCQKLEVQISGWQAWYSKGRLKDD